MIAKYPRYWEAPDLGDGATLLRIQREPGGPIYCVDPDGYEATLHAGPFIEEAIGWFGYTALTLEEFNKRYAQKVIPKPSDGG